LHFRAIHSETTESRSSTIHSVLYVVQIDIPDPVTATANKVMVIIWINFVPDGTTGSFECAN
jgi:hypothetical protein